MADLVRIDFNFMSGSGHFQPANSFLVMCISSSR